MFGVEGLSIERRCSAATYAWIERLSHVQIAKEILRGGLLLRWLLVGGWPAKEEGTIGDSCLLRGALLDWYLLLGGWLGHKVKEIVV